MSGFPKPLFSVLNFSQMNLRSLRILFSLIIGLLMILCAWTYWNLNNYIQTVGNIRKYNSTIQLTSQVMSLVKDAETGHRGYQLTYDKKYLEPYYHAQIFISGELEKLENETADFPEIKENVIQFNRLVKFQLSTIEQILQATNWKNSPFQEEEIRLMGVGKNNMDRIRLEAEKINQVARRMVLEAIQDEGGFKDLTPINLLVIALIAFGGLVLLFSKAVLFLEERDKKSKNLEIALNDLQEETEKRIHTGNLLRSVLDNSRDGIMAFLAVRDENQQIQDFKFLLANEASSEMVHKSQNQLIGKSLLEVFPGNEEMLFPAYRQVTETGEDFRTEIEYAIEGKNIWFKILAVKFNDGIIVTFSDITYEKDTELKLLNYTQELKRSNEDLEQFAYVASHDLQEPLRKIRSFGDRLITKYHEKLDHTGKDYIERMQVASKRMQNLIEDLLAFSRITRSSELPGKVSINKLLLEIQEDLSHQISSEGASLIIGEIPPVLGVRAQIQRLFQNLISNAIKFRKSEGKPVVEVAGELISAAEITKEFSLKPQYKNYVKITVSDNGIGFDEKYLEQIFNVFQRLHGKNEFQGTGIGLAICKKIVTHHGGLITATSLEGKGSDFIVILPAST
jgi:signal transduction histidine kinase/CHASE3 domain sensor protein